jgi:hypothetical protein
MEREAIGVWSIGAALKTAQITAFGSLVQLQNDTV